jgi:hypothetical protein
MCKSPLVMPVLVVAWLLVAGSALADERPVVMPPPHASGGIGEDDPLVAMAGDFNLKLVFAMQGSGEYLADIKVLIADADGHALLKTESPGPHFFVRLPAGTYRISAEFYGKALNKSVAITDRGLQSLYFYWPRIENETETRRN